MSLVIPPLHPDSLYSAIPELVAECPVDEALTVDMRPPPYWVCLSWVGGGVPEGETGLLKRFLTGSEWPRRRMLIT